MKTPRKSPAGGIRLRSRATILCLLAAAVGLATWHGKYRHDRSAATPSGRAEITSRPSSADQGAATGQAAANPQPAVQYASRPEDGPAWSLPYGREFWRPNAAPSTPRKGDTNPVPTFNVNEVVERVSHAFVQRDDGTLPQVQARTYKARFDQESGLGFSPHRPVDNNESGKAARQNSGLPGDTHPSAKARPDPTAEVWFRTVAVARDGQALFTAGQNTPAWSFLGNTVQGLLNEVAGMVAHFEARANGVEAAWILSRPPAGTGPLMVEAEVNGLSYAGRSEQGHHYADAAGVARVRVGQVTAVDAAGSRWDLAMSATGNRLHLEVPTAVLAQAIYPLAIDPALEAEFEIDKRVVGAAENEQKAPAVAAGDDGYLVVWYDGQTERIRGTRVTKDGDAIDPMGLPIQTTGTGQDPAVAANDDGYLVVWDMVRGDGNFDVVGTRVTKDGVVSDSAGILIRADAGPEPFPAVASKDDDYLVVWRDDRNQGIGGADIYGARVSEDGVLSDPDGFAISSAPGDQTSPSVAASSSGYLVVWQDGRTDSDIYGSRVTSGGTVQDPNGIPISTAANEQAFPSVTSSGNRYFVVWDDLRNIGTAGRQIFGARLSTSGVVQDPNGIAISKVANPLPSPSVAAGDDGFLVVWVDSRVNTVGQHIYGSRVSNSGGVSDPNGITIANAPYDQYAPSVAANGSSYLVVWEDNRTNGFTRDIYAARVTSSGNVKDRNGTVISTAENNQFYPSVAASSSGYLVVWEDGRNSDITGLDIYGARVTTSGSISDPNGIAISLAVSNQFSPSVAAGNDGYLVVWWDGRNLDSTVYDIYGSRVTKNGNVQDPQGIAICTAPQGQYAAVVAASSSGYFVAWSDDRNIGATDWDIYGARVSTSGLVLDPDGIPICTADHGQFVPSLAASSAGYFVAWSDNRNDGSTAFDIYGSRLTTAGVVLDPAGIPISVTANDQFTPSVTAGVDGYLVAWQDYRNVDADIFAARVTTGGVVADPSGIPICTLAGDQSDPSALATPDGYEVVWTDANSSSLFWHRLNRAGDLLEGVPLAINGSYGRSSAATAYGGSGRFFLVGDSVRNAGFEPRQRVIGSLHSTSRPSSGPVIDFQKALFKVDEDDSKATITVSLEGDTPGVVSVDYATIGGTAQAGVDYEAQTGTLLFPKGTDKQTFTIPIFDNTIDAEDKTVNLLLSNPGGGATLGTDYRAVLVINDNDDAGKLSFDDASVSVKESTHSVVVKVKRSGGKASGVTIGYATGGGTALAGTDYVAQTGTLSFGAGDSSKSITIPIIDNLFAEGNKTFYVHLFNPTGGATLDNPSVATVKILDDDGPVR